MAELADALDLGSSGKPWGFESPLSHHNYCLGSEIVKVHKFKGRIRRGYEGFGK